MSKTVIEKLLKRGVVAACALLLSAGPAVADQHEGEAEAEESAPAAAAEAAAEAASMAEPAAAPEPLTGEVDLPGLWVVTVETPDGAGSEGELTITENEDGTLSGVWVTDIGTAEFPTIDVDGNAVSFGAEVDFGGVLVPINFEGSTGGEKIQGIVNLEFDGQPLSLPATGEKGTMTAMADAATTGGLEPLTGEVNLPGEWEFNAELPDGSVSTSSMTVTDENGALVALIQTELGEARIDNIAVDGNMIEFATDIDMGGVLVPLSFEGSTGDDQLQGEVKLNFEGQDMVLPITGSRKGAAALTGPVNLPGLWEMAAELPDGSTSGSSLTVREKEGALVAVLETEIGEATIKGITVDGNKVAFDTEIDMGGVLIPMKFDGSTGGEKIQGTVNLNMDGQEMNLPITGTRTGDAPPEAPEPAAAPASEGEAAAGESEAGGDEGEAAAQ